MTRYLLVGALVSLSAGPADSAPTCGPTVLSIYGDILGSGLVPGTLELGWKVLEDATVREYRLSRYDCTRPRHCSVHVATVEASSAPPLPSAEPRTYAVTDIAPPGLWTYRLKVIRTGTRNCIEEVPVAVPPLSCDMSQLCEQVEASFIGEVIVGGARLRWSSSMESSVAGYRVLRFDPASSPHETEVAVLSATASCGQASLRSFAETPPSGNWRYALEVFDHAGAVGCRIETRP